MKKSLWMIALLLLTCLVGIAAFMLSNSAAPAPDAIASFVDTVYFTEICAKNEMIIADNDGKFSDYIELYNSGSPLSLKGYTLFDGKVKSAPFGDLVLGENEYRIIFVNRSNTGFAISASGGDSIQLLDPYDRIVTQTTILPMQADEVMLWNHGTYHKSFLASPGFPNDSNGVMSFQHGTPGDFDHLVVSEVMIGNVSTLPDEKGVYSDIVELHNISQYDIDLSRYFLSDSLENRFRYRLPEIMLGADEYLVLYCDSENYISTEGYIHTNFGLTHGEKIVLTMCTGEYMAEEVSYIGDDISWSLGTDGEFAVSDPSVGFSNDSNGIRMLRDSRINWNSALVISEVLHSSSGVPYMGEFCDVVEISNTANETVKTAGWYLSDGGDPYSYPLPEKELKPGESLTIICKPETTGFSLSEGETLQLTGTDYRCAPPVNCTTAEFGKSLSLLRDGEECGYVFADVTLGYPNEPAYHESFQKEHANQDLRFSEIMSSNQSYLMGAYQTTSDWIEFYNASEAEIHLSEYFLTDRKGNLEKYRLPDRVLAPGEYLVILLKDDPTNLPKKYDVIPNNLSSDGETLYLSKNGQVIDYVFLPQLMTDMSYGRAPGNVLFTLMESATPCGANLGGVELSAMPVAMTPQGVYNGVSYVDVVLSGDGEIFYTTDCSIPNEKTLRYSDPIRLTKTTVLRVFSKEPGKLPSQVLDLTYVINENDTLPVVSMVTSPENLWDNNTGIYATGDYAEEEDPYYGANFWMGWEKPASISLFETDGNGFSVNCGVRIFGGFTRAMIKKSFACMFRETYGAGSLKYPVFGENGLDTFEALVLRTSGQDAFTAKMRDVVVTSLIGEYTDIPVQDYKPVILYLNGEYWGLYYIREKLNEHYIAGHYNIPARDVTMVKLAGWSNIDYIELLRYTENHDMTEQEHYDYVCSKIDVDNYIDFYIAEMWTGNTDNGNVRYYLNEEGKWTWILYDMDLALYDSNLNSVEKNLSSTGIGPGDVSCKTFAVKLMANEDFRDRFLERLAWQMNTIWTEENIIGRVNDIEAMIMADMHKETARWYATFDQWENHVEDLRQYARERNDYMLEYIQAYFDLSEREMRKYGFDV